MKKCPKCKVQNPDNANYCLNCGKTISKHITPIPVGIEEETAYTKKVDYHQTVISTRFAMEKVKRSGHIDNSFFYLFLFVISFALGNLLVIVELLFNTNTLLAALQGDAWNMATAVCVVLFLLMSFVWTGSFISFDKKLRRSLPEFKMSFKSSDVTYITVINYVTLGLRIATAILVWGGIFRNITSLFSEENVATLLTTLGGLGIEGFDPTQLALNESLAMITQYLPGISFVLYGIILVLAIPRVMQSVTFATLADRSIRLLRAVAVANASIEASNLGTSTSKPKKTFSLFGGKKKK